MNTSSPLDHLRETCARVTPSNGPDKAIAQLEVYLKLLAEPSSDWVIKFAGLNCFNLAMDITDPLLRTDLIQALLDCPPGIDTGTHEFVNKALEIDAFELLPVLHAAGFIIDKATDAVHPMVEKLAEGHWPYPELLWPDLMKSSHAEPLFSYILVGHNNTEDYDAIAILNRLSMLDHDENTREMAETAVAKIAWGGTHWNSFMALPKRDEILAHMMGIGWLTEAGVAQQADDMALGTAKTKAIGELLSEVERKYLHGNTAGAKPGSRGMRL